MKNANADCNEAGTLCCASCGIAEKNDNDDIKLKNCTACYLVRYCSIECQKEHRPKHKQACKERAAELRNELLFKQPESTHLGDCPICMMPLPLDPEKSIMMSCCSKVICNGCAYANHKREVEASLVPSCLFCRKHRLESSEEIMKQLMKRVEVNDPVAMRRVAFEQYIKEEYRSAFEYWTKAAKLGDAASHFKLAAMYNRGQGVVKDTKKEVHHLEKAALSGHPGARHNLGCYEWEDGNFDRAVKHWTIAVKQGYDNSIKELMDAFKRGLVEKEVLAANLRAHQAAVDATKSPQRKEAEAKIFSDL